MIRNILSLASNRDQAYQLALNSQDAADLVIVNADDPSAMVSWNELRQVFPETRVVLAAATPVFESDYVCIKRPLIASQLHSILALGAEAKAPTPKPQKYEVLRKSFLFRHLATGHLEKIAALARVLTLPAQHVVFEKADAGEEMLVVLSGRLKISVANREGREIVLGTLGPGEIFGEIAMLDGCGRSATAITLTPCELLGIHRKDFMPFLEQNPRAAVDLITVLALRLRLNTEQLAELITEEDVLR
ncbi:MAG TPA: cyclic nucleotide-binding domain-containing protein [Candidatus Contendobacter sp.]|nr:cyclic nucleotide-binding domain-containing protein [Candidatus Contendobacter sp.]HRZ23928.1 cyclic nucleotide-binding domain-containing protein [Candidatus Contendobacter sp.]HRZ51703.1 cyclic nucleotide-binding domain-containing protein [Candidatus Contendobacter sp.]